MTRRSGHLQGFTAERYLWHGTHSRFIKSIATIGFRREFTTTFVYGNGCYYATRPNYSASTSYAKLDEASVQRMFYCRVAVGMLNRGNSRNYTPEVIPNTKVRYDSFCDSEQNPSIIATCNDNQAYPDLIVTFVKNSYESNLKNYRNTNPTYTLDGTYR